MKQLTKTIAKQYSTPMGQAHKLYNFTLADINNNLINADYAVRGLVPSRASQIATAIKQQSGKYPFKELVQCNIGNPLIFGQIPLTFNRQVIGALLNPDYLQMPGLNPDVKKKVRFYLDQIGKGSNVGAYTESHGFKFVRESIRDYIQRRDQSVDIENLDNIFLVDGASQGVHMAMQAFISHQRDGVMIPIPQYPLYTATIALNGGQECHYYLDESKGWQVNLAELQKSYLKSKNLGINPKILVVINPGNPTGQVMSKSTIQEMIRFAFDNKLVIFADEVYQDNIYDPKCKFVSFKKARQELPFPYNQTELISFHSTSKGMLGECGLRGGYMELSGINQDIKEQLVKLRSIFLCSNSVGQICTDLMTNRPRQGVVSKQTYEEFQKEWSVIFNAFKKNAKMTTEMFNSMDNITCCPIQGAMYAFPRVKFSNKIIEAARKKGQPADLYYSLALLHQTGIVVVPGSGFRQEDGTYHFRTTILVRPYEKLLDALKRFKEFNNKFHNGGWKNF